MKKTLFLLMILPLVFLGQNRSINFEHGTWSEVLSKAKKENKLIMMDAFTTWCGPCKWMAKNVFTNDTVADYYNTNYVNAKIDMEKGEGIDLAKKYGVQAYPTFLFIDGDGNLVHRVCGSDQPKDFIQTGKDALTPEKTLAYAEKKFNATPSDPDVATAYFKAMSAACASVGDKVDKYFVGVKESEYSSELNWKILNEHVSNSKSPAFIYLLKHQDEFTKKYGSDPVSKKIERVYEQSFRTIAGSKDKVAFDVLKKEVSQNMAGDVDNIIWKGELLFHSANKDWAAYASVASQYVDKYGLNDPSMLNQYAWTFYEHVTEAAMLEKAARWAKRSVELDDKYYNNDTYAAVLFKLGKKADAKKAAEHAIELGKKDGTDVKETEDLLKKINELK